jgi:hypothetical protein
VAVRADPTGPRRRDHHRGRANVLANLQRKADQADRMFTALVAHMNDALAVTGATYDTPVEVPAWLAS